MKQKKAENAAANLGFSNSAQKHQALAGLSKSKPKPNVSAETIANN
jgi:hypothetical protein